MMYLFGFPQEQNVTQNQFNVGLHPRKQASQRVGAKIISHQYSLSGTPEALNNKSNP